MDFQSDLITRIIQLSLDEDASYEDITSRTFISPEQMGIGTIHFKQEGIVCGLPLIERINEVFGDSRLQVKLLTEEGTTQAVGASVAQIYGPTGVLLTLERIYLNFIQRLSGIATMTAVLVEAAKDNIILDTRKTTPGLRLLEKYAVVCGGGKNHRRNLSELILIKNNHIDAAGGDFTVLKTKLEHSTASYIPLEVEVRGQQELEDTLTFLSPKIVMLDNYSDKDIEDAVDYIRANANEVKIEVSGGMNKERIEHLASKFQGLYISVGALTTQAMNIDISMKIVDASSNPF